MFRRKEDSLFDTATDSNQDASEHLESATVITPSQPSASSNSAAGAAYSGSSSMSSQPSRAASDSRQAPPAANSFRPNSPITSDISRNRMPEAKSAMNPSVNPSVAPERANKSGKRVLTVGNDILLKGEIATCDRLVIEGKVDATLNDVHTVEIAETGSFKGAAHIEDAEISGLFEGDLIVRNRLIIYATGKVRGKITYGEIEIERGGELTGEIKTTNAQAASSSGRPSSTRTPAKEDKVAA